MSPIFKGHLTHEDGTDRLSQNVGTVLPLYVVEYPRRAKISSTSQQML